jgi:hypothetical protein
MTLRRVLVSILALVAVLAGVAVYFLREPPPSADSIERMPSYQDAALLKRAWALPVAHLYGPDGYVFQKNPSICGPTSIADVPCVRRAYRLIRLRSWTIQANGTPLG